MDTNTLLKQADYVRYEAIISGIQAAQIDKWVDLIKKAQDCIKADRKLMKKNPEFAEINNKVLCYAHSELKKYINNLSDVLNTILADRPYLKEQVLAIV